MAKSTRSGIRCLLVCFTVGLMRELTSSQSSSSNQSSLTGPVNPSSSSNYTTYSPDRGSTECSGVSQSCLWEYLRRLLHHFPRCQSSRKFLNGCYEPTTED
ncbi:hypothetical protein BS47DRAFT_946184 [Hydnum rufescens UP504]|uniref:Uncharacterized protein n=1 Tax=Hydnum rufescens UP504 TaxID=1448309 RepID=A0A9P6AXA4_9AGAM|nr:hypothetical protein BS47DRAFT_946184 [Hydnum rufescens UP504]